MPATLSAGRTFGNLSAAAVHRALDSLLEQSVDGLVIVAPHYEALTLDPETPARAARSRGPPGTL